MKTLTDSLDYVRVEYLAQRLASEAICARAVCHYADSDMDMAARHKAALKGLDEIAEIFGYELRDPSDTSAPIPVLDPITANDDAEPTVTLADAANVWRGYVDCALSHGMTFSEAQEAFRRPFPLHHKLLFASACDAPRTALAAE